MRNEGEKIGTQRAELIARKIESVEHRLILVCIGAEREHQRCQIVQRKTTELEPSVLINRSGSERYCWCGALVVIGGYAMRHHAPLFDATPVPDIIVIGPTASPKFTLACDAASQTRRSCLERSQGLAARSSRIAERGRRRRATRKLGLGVAGARSVAVW